MTGRMNWTRQQKHSRQVEQAFPNDQRSKSPWSHVKQAPGKRLTKDEIAALLSSRPDLKSSTGSRAHARGRAKDPPSD